MYCCDLEPSKLSHAPDLIKLSSTFLFIAWLPTLHKSKIVLKLPCLFR